MPLSFVHENTPLYRAGRARAGATGREDILMVAVTRLFLDNIRNIQTSWVKLGRKMAEMTPLSGANNLGETMFEESISRSAGARGTDYLTLPRCGGWPKTGTNAPVRLMKGRCWMPRLGDLPPHTRYLQAWRFTRTTLDLKYRTSKRTAATSAYRMYSLIVVASFLGGYNHPCYLPGAPHAPLPGALQTNPG